MKTQDVGPSDVRLRASQSVLKKLRNRQSGPGAARHATVVVVRAKTVSVGSKSYPVKVSIPVGAKASS